MSVITNKSFAVPCVGIDPITKGQFIIQSAHMMWDYDAEAMSLLSRARGEFYIAGPNNPLYQIAKESPLRLQGLVASVMFGVEKRFIKFEIIKYFQIVEDELVAEMNMEVTFQILESNLEYLENIIEYKDQNSL